MPAKTGSIKVVQVCREHIQVPARKPQHHRAGNSTILGAQQLPAASSTPPTQEPKDRLYALVNKYDDVYNGILRNVQNLQQRMAELNHITDQFYELKAYYLANRLDAEANKIELLRPTLERRRPFLLTEIGATAT